MKCTFPPISVFGGLLSRRFPSISVVGATVRVSGQGESKTTPLQPGVAKVSSFGRHELVEEHQAQSLMEAHVSHDE